MDISQFSKRCVFIAPVKNDVVLSQTQQEEIRNTLEKEFTRLRDSGVEAVICIGGMNLDYARYDVSHIIPCVMLFHTTFQHFEAVPEFYDTTIQDVITEIEYVDNRCVFLETLIMEDEYKIKLEEIRNTNNYLLDIGEIDIEVQPKLLAKYWGKDLLVNWLKEQKVLITFGNHKQTKELKKSFDGNKIGLKIDINMSSTKHYVCNNLMRDDIIFGR